MGRTTRFGFDSRGRQTRRTLPDGLSEKSVYDDRSLADVTGAGQPLERSTALEQTEYAVDFEGRVTAYRYDNTALGGGRLAAKLYYATEAAYLADRADGVLSGARERVELSFDAHGREVESRFYRQDGTTDVTTSTYDADGRTLAVASPEGTVRYEYDALGRKTRTFTGALNDAVTDTRYGYDALGRLNRVAVHERFNTPLATPEVTEYSYDKNGSLDKIERPGKVVTDYAYDALGRLDIQTDFFDADGDRAYTVGVDTLLASYDYEVRADGKRTGVTEVNDLGAVTRFDYAYDALGRLVEERYDAAGTQFDYIDTFAFDLTSNRTRRTRDLEADGDIDVTTAYAYDTNDRIVSETTDHTDSTDDRFTEYAFDGTTQVTKSVYAGTGANGRKLEETRSTYNLQGRMARTVVTKFAANGVSIASQDVYEYAYNETGLRVSQSVGGVTTVYLLDLQNPTGYAKPIEEPMYRSEIK